MNSSDQLYVFFFLSFFFGTSLGMIKYLIRYRSFASFDSACWYSFPSLIIFGFSFLFPFFFLSLSTLSSSLSLSLPLSSFSFATPSPIQSTAPSPPFFYHAFNIRVYRVMTFSSWCSLVLLLGWYLFEYLWGCFVLFCGSCGIGRTGTGVGFIAGGG